MIDASKRIVCVFVDCAWGKKNGDLSSGYKVRGYPTVVFCDSEGKPLGLLDDRDPASVAKSINDLADRYSGKPAAKPDPKPAPEPKPAAPARTGKPQLIFFFDSSPASTSVDAALKDPSVKELLPRFELYKAEYKKDSPQSQKFDVSRAPTILILEVNAEKKESKLLARITGSRSARELRRDLDEALAAVAPAKPEEPAARGAAPAPPEEKLSDDELERKFIHARVGIALEMQKQGKKDKAIEILEDVVKTYPNHVDTPAVRKMLENLKK